MQTTVLQTILLILLASKFFCEQFLGSLNLKKIKQNKAVIPHSAFDYMNKEEWQKCSNYTIAKIHFSRLENIFSFLLSIIILLFLLPLFYNQWAILYGSGFWVSAIFTATFLILIQQIEMPFDWYRQFRLEDRYGFNKQTLGLWFTDKVKELILGCFLLIFLIALVQGLHLQLSAWSPNYWWVIAFFALFVFQLLLMVLWPRLILPLFNTLKPLEDVELRDKLQQLSEKTGFQTKEIQVLDGSKRSSHSNAFFTGFGKFRKIVLYDTLIQQMSQNEIIAVVAHEIGHYKLGHIPKRLAISFVTGLLLFWTLASIMDSTWFTEELKIPTSFGGEIGPVLLSFILFGGCITYWFSPFSNYFSRRHEYQADDFAVSVTGSSNSLPEALKKLSVKNLSYPLPHSWVSFFHHSHPSVPERILNIRKSSN